MDRKKKHKSRPSEKLCKVGGEKGGWKMSMTTARRGCRV